MARVTRAFLRDVWALARPYWFSEDRWAGRGLLAVVLAMTLGMVYLNVQFNEWYRLFYNALQARDAHAFWHQLERFAILAAIFIVLAVYQVYLRQMLQIRWREWLTQRYLKDWLGDQTYYRMELVGGSTDNPDQRISQDLNLFVGQTLTLSLGFLNAVVTLASFVGILWVISGPLVVPLGGTTVTIAGYMVWAAVLYAIAGTWLTHRIGRPLIRLNYDQQRYEADFRFGLVRLRENTEGIALYKGEDGEREILGHSFQFVVKNWWAIMLRQKSLTWFTSFYGQLAVIFPFLVASPRYFAGTIGLGVLVQISSAFGQVQGSLTWFVDAYTSLAEWKATVDRLTGFTAAMNDHKSATAQSALTRQSGEPQIAVEALRLALPQGQTLLDGLALHVEPAQSVLISGPSGAGKSTLFRALAGIWPYGEGTIRMPADERVLFVPQKPYLPLGNLRAVVSYPQASLPDSDIKSALESVGLSDLCHRLDEKQNWSLQLSPGEQQRLAAARALLARPDWLFLDEATSAMDETAESRVYEVLRERLPGTALVSIGHRPSLKQFHERRLMLARGGALGPMPEAGPALLVAGSP
jgi:vitamin B12/bleomycin/antimicrobial peptide transport system ATP-binding/permease protein